MGDPGGPWVWNRVLRVWRIGGARSSVDLVRHTVACLQEIAGSDEAWQQLKTRIRFYAHDNASDENLASDLLKAELPNLDFDMPDTLHSRQLVFKNAMSSVADPEIRDTQRLLVTGTDPEPSLANFLAHSQRFATVFQEEEQALGLSLLRDLGWSPQRFDSRSKPLGRTVFGRHDSGYQGVVMFLGSEPLRGQSTSQLWWLAPGLWWIRQ